MITPSYKLLRQSFKLSSQMGAHTLILCNLLDNDYQVAHVDKIQIRFGIEYCLKKVTIKKK